MTTTARQRRAAAVAALTLAGCALTGTPAVAANNGDVKIHAQYEPTAEQDNDPHVCRFYLDAFNFDAGEEVHWTIATQPPSTGGTVKEGDLTLTAAGAGSTEVISLANGHYKLTWATGDGDGQNKHKVFWVECPPGGPGGGPGGPGGGPGGPHGGPPAGGGGLARADAFTPVAGAAAVGMAAVGGVVWFRLRRRPHGA
ncbi:hypothetical protein [Streptomyces sp. WM6386]|uniref:hypothetical protein n=1 Tax=Streptomyces sp. WM6386 TaxID=1415558 RepID=UPI00061A042C|nr:hypothetical protein [Streptomyces sp. WM6386]KKD09425.1 hypothetical protein TN53_02720 [Streptomyces sp. WM6386]